ncbi:uncharacterized protein DDB_G0287625 [Spodoptera frugiperda]|uniref:Uncharacterized protein DDB_G0287625 n=1 Tax=Spodoptera frugiperda TaxID=7108 RepID=A0A9R0DII0_SPOFR|nr:uncharacterized protein DDB_G0287625 [Spodoptera frugiperda]
MNFLRKLFPSNKNAKNLTSITDTTTNCIETRMNGENSHSDSNLNDLEMNSTLKNCEGEINIEITAEHILDDVIHELDSNKTFHVLTNVPPTEISCNNDDGIKKVNKSPEVLNNNSEDIFKENGEEQVPNVVDNESKIKEINSTNVVDEVNLQLKEFEEVLVNIDDYLTTDNLETQCSLNSNELDDILNEIDTANEDLHTEINNNNISDETNPNNIMNDRKVSNNSEIIDVISINSSIDEEISENEVTIDLISDSDDSESCEGYHSSDFEFISETEARMDGFIINFRQNRPNEDLEQFHGYPGQFAEELFGDRLSDPGEGPSNRNEFEDRTYRDNHRIPEGDNYLQLFQGLYNPLMAVSEIYFLENKSVRTSAMNSQYDGMGFDKQLAMRRHQPDSSEDEFGDDAKTTAGKILNMYPRENRKRRRRR